MTNAATSILSVRKVNAYTVTVTPSDFQNAAFGTFIRVDVAAPCSSNALSPMLFYRTTTLTGTVQMMKEF